MSSHNLPSSLYIHQVATIPPRELNSMFPFVSMLIGSFSTADIAGDGERTLQTFTIKYNSDFDPESSWI